MTDDLMEKAKELDECPRACGRGRAWLQGAHKEKELRRGTDKTLRTVLTRQSEDEKRGHLHYRSN